MASARAPISQGERWLGGLGRWIVRHPWHPIVFWVVLLVVVIPFLPYVGSVTTNSTQSVPANAPSSVANAEFARLFPSSAGGSSSILLFTGPNLTDRNAQGVIQNVTAALRADRSLSEVAAVSSVYTAYAGYLAGQVEIAAGAVAAAQGASPSLSDGVNQSAQLLWGPPALFFSTWSSDVSNGSSFPPSHWNYPAYAATRGALGNNSASQAVLAAFYGVNGSGAGFNGTAGCASSPAPVACADSAARSTEGPLIPQYFPAAPGYAVPNATLGALAIENSTLWSSVRATAALVLGPTIGYPASWVESVWAAFSSPPTPSAAAGFANGTVSNATLWTEPLRVPFALSSQYVDSAGTASIVSVAYRVADDFTNASGGQPVYSDFSAIDARAGSVLARSDPTRSIAYVQTGSGPLDLLTQTAVNSTLALVLPLTVGLLLAIAMLYFRSPVTPLVTFAGLGIALVLALGATILVGTLVHPVDSTALTLEEVFVLGVGTDYSIFLVARYREEIVHGRTSDEAIVQAVAWAGQSVATSGSTAVIATLALTFSGVALLSQWGSVLSLAILITLLLSLTLVPAFLKVLGPRIFWPDSGERFRRRADRAARRIREEDTYFYRVGRATQRHPVAILGVLLLVSAPLVYTAVEVPLAYDFYGQLPSGYGATDGLATLYSHYGNGYATPSLALVTFASPVVVGNRTNASEFTQLAAITSLAANTSGIASVESPVGPFGAPLGVWLNLSHLPLAPQENLLGSLSGFVGTDGRTVLLQLTPTATGLSESAVSAVQSVESRVASYTATHPAVTQVAYGGGAPTIGDLANQTQDATLILIVAVTVGLVAVLLLVLRSWVIALMAIATIGLSISWAWSLTYFVFQELLGFPLFFYVRTLLFLLVLGLGIDYNIFVLTRVREERLKGATSSEAVVTAVGRTGGIITAAAIILASAFAAITVGEFTLIRAIGFSVAIAVVLDAMVVRTYLVPAALHLLKDRAWGGRGSGPRAGARVATEPD